MTEDIAVTFNAGQVRIFVNGVSQATVLDLGTVPTCLAASSVPLNVGYWNGLGRYIDGTIGDLNIWNVAKTQAQIESLGGDTIPYSQMTADQRCAGLQQSFTLDEPSGNAVDSVSGCELQNPTGVTPERLVSSWTSTGTLPDTFVPSTKATNGAPLYTATSNMNGQAAISFSGQSSGANGYGEALTYNGTALPNDASGDVFMVVEFTGNINAERLDTIFSSASDTAAVDYQFFALFSNVYGVPTDEGGNEALMRLRWRDDTLQDDIRGELTQIQPNVPYVIHMWGYGQGTNEYGMTINGLNQGQSYY